MIRFELTIDIHLGHVGFGGDILDLSIQSRCGSRLTKQPLAARMKSGT
jgi:hypothetical protein